MRWQSRPQGCWDENGFWKTIFKVGLRSSKSVSPSCVRETVNGAKSVSWLQSRSAAFCGEDAFGTAGAISTRRVDSFRAKLPPCFLTRTILTRAVRDPPRVWASTTDFFEEKGSGVLNPTPKYRSRPLPLRLKTILAQESTETCGQRRPKNQALRGPLLRRTQRPAWSCHT